MTAVLPSQTSISGLSLSQLTGSRRTSSLKESKSSLNSDMSTPDLGNDEDATITINKNIGTDSRKSLDDLQFLAISAQITEIGYSISDVQTRIFEIQELRHQAEAQAPAASGAAATTSVDGHAVSTEPSTTNIDQALIHLDEKLESITTSISAIDQALEPLIKASKTPTSSVPLSAKTPTQANVFPGDDNAATLLRKHSALLQDWEAVQEEAETLKGELREDKWLAVFRTVGEQAEAMMVSLEKAVAHCQEFIWQVHKSRKAATEDSHSQVSSGSNWGADRPVNYEVFQSLLSSYEAKKRYYMPATTKVLSILDRSVRDRVTKNGECLRRHAEARARWKNLRERINRIDADMENVRLYFVNKEREHNEPEPSDAGSTLSRQTSRSNVTNKSNYLSTPSMFSRKTLSDTSKTSGTRSRADSGAASAVSRTMSPLKRFASKVTASVRSSSGLSDGKSPAPSRTASSASISAPKQLKATSSTNDASSTSGVASKGAPKPPPRSPFRPPGNRIAVSSPEPSEAIEVDNNSKKKRESLFPFLSKPPPPSALGRSTNRAPSRSSMSGGETSSSSTKPRWSSSTKIEDPPPPSSQNTIRATPSRPSVVNHAFRPITPVEGAGRSVSRNENKNGPSRPGSSMKGHSSWNSLSALDASNAPPVPPRAQSRTGARTPGNGFYGTSPRARPETPSGIPRPPSRAASEAAYVGGSEYDDIPTSLMQRAFTPGPRSFTPGGSVARARRPSNSLIPVPKLNITSGSRPGTAMSMSPSQGGSRATSPSLSADGHGRKSPGVKESPSAWKGVTGTTDSPSNLPRAGARSQTPESMLRARAMQMPVFLDNDVQGNGLAKSQNGTTPARPRQSVGAPSSFKGEKSDGKTLTFGPGGDGPDPKSPSRPGSRFGFGRSMTPMDGPLQPYVPVKTDELDVEVANILNGMAHGFLIERVDPPRKTAAKPGEEIRAQYAVSNALGRKVITCRLVTVTRAGTQSKKVMCRVGGGWLELQMYILNRQAGLS